MFVLSAGQIQRIHRMPTYTPIQSTHLKMAPSVYQTYEHIWRTQPAVRTVVGFIARNVAQMGVHVFERRDDDDRERVSDHPLAELLAVPFPGTPWTTYRLVNWTVHELGIYDDAYWLKGRSGRLNALMPMPRRFIRPVGENPMMPDAYEIIGNGGQAREVPPDQVVHFHGYNPDDLRIGTSPIETLRQVLAEEYAAGKYREQLWNNGARVGGYIARPREAPRWSPDARMRFRREWQEQYAGNDVDAGGTPVLEDGMVFTPSGVTPRDAQYVEARKLTREEVAVAYFIHPSMMGIMDGTGSNAVKDIHRMLYQDAFGPLITGLAQDIEAQLLPDLDAFGALTRTIYVEFNLAEKLRGSFEEQAAALQASVGGPFMTRSEARSRMNLPHLDEADELIVPLNVVNGGLASPQDTAPNNPSNAESNDLPPGPKPANV